MSANQDEGRDTPPPRAAPLLLPILLASAVASAFRLTGYVEDDAFITFRTAFNLADHGSYSFNLGEGHPGATSLLWGLLVAVLRIAAGEFAVLLALAFGLGATLLAAFLFADALAPRPAAPQRREALFLAGALNPAALSAAVSGMETPVLLVALALLLNRLTRGDRLGGALAIVLLPLIRVDAIAIGLIAVACAALANRGLARALIFGLLAGLGAMAAGMWTLSGAPLAVTALAKEITYAPDRSAEAIAGRLAEMFGAGGFLPGLHLTALPLAFYALTGLAMLAVILMGGAGAVRALLADRRRGISPRGPASARPDAAAHSPNAASAVVRAILAATALALPAAYAIGGVLFNWYTWPATVAAWLIVVDTLSRRRSGRAVLRRGLLPALLVLASLSAIGVLTYGERIRHLSEIADEIGRHAHPEDRLALEPAGVIPFRTGLETLDYVGLASPRVLAYREAHGPGGWWIAFLTGERPEILVEYFPVHTGGQIFGGHRLGPEDLAWFNRTYRLVSTRSFAEHLRDSGSIFAPLLALAQPRTYHVYLRRE